MRRAGTPAGRGVCARVAHVAAEGVLEFLEGAVRSSGSLRCVPGTRACRRAMLLDLGAKLGQRREC